MFPQLVVLVGLIVCASSCFLYRQVDLTPGIQDDAAVSIVDGSFRTPMARYRDTPRRGWFDVENPWLDADLVGVDGVSVGQPSSVRVSPGEHVLTVDCRFHCSDCGWFGTNRLIRSFVTAKTDAGFRYRVVCSIPVPLRLEDPCAVDLDNDPWGEDFRPHCERGLRPQNLAWKELRERRFMFGGPLSLSVYRISPQDEDGSLVAQRPVGVLESDWWWGTPKPAIECAGDWWMPEVEGFRY